MVESTASRGSGGELRSDSTSTSLKEDLEDSPFQFLSEEPPKQQFQQQSQQEDRFGGFRKQQPHQQIRCQQQQISTSADTCEEENLFVLKRVVMQQKIQQCASQIQKMDIVVLIIIFALELVLMHIWIYKSMREVISHKTNNRFKRKSVKNEYLR